MQLGEIFCDGMVFQARKAIRIFGTANGKVVARFLGEERSIVADGKWVLEFSAHDYGGPYVLEVEVDDKIEVISDIMIGEVVLFSGQSNMQFRMSEGNFPPERYADDNMLRIFVSERIEQGEPLSPVDGWTRAKCDNIANWSALAYLTGVEMRKAGVPAVGVVVCAQGASNIQSWIDDSILVGSELDLPIEQCHGDSRNPEYMQWNMPGMLYHFMLERLMPFYFGNVVWYQGESNTSVAEGHIYMKLLDRMINNWRKEFQVSDLPFTVVQIADFTDSEAWRLVQQAQLAAAKMIHGVKAVISGDVCEKNMMHPLTKDKLAKRIFSSLCLNM